MSAASIGRIPFGRADPLVAVSYGCIRYDKLAVFLCVLTDPGRSMTELSEATLMLRRWLWSGEIRPSDFRFGLEDAEVEWFVLGDILLAGLVTKVAQVLKVGDGWTMSLLEYVSFLTGGGREASIFRLCLDELDLSHPLGA